jgi:hypothetical protein
MMLELALFAPILQDMIGIDQIIWVAMKDSEGLFKELPINIVIDNMLSRLRHYYPQQNFQLLSVGWLVNLVFVKLLGELSPSRSK